MEQLETKIVAQVERQSGASKKAYAPPVPVSTGNKAVAREIDTLTQKLNDAARDIIEELDGLPADLERRFSKNEKDVYIESLHEARGRKLVKALTKRYLEEKSIRTRVDSYIRLFERLLDSVAEAPKGNQMVEACLASHSGEVYMMLAQVSGRIATE
jgi:hypothetical protein